MRVHVIGGGAEALPVLESLRTNGYSLSVGPVSTEDSSYHYAVYHHLPVVVAPPFSQISDEAHAEHLRLIQEAGLIVVPPIPFGEGNLRNLLAVEQATETLQDERFRVFPITAGELLLEGTVTDLDQSNKYVGDKWGGKYLRAPDIFFTIIEKGKDKLVRLNTLAKVQRGFTTGANDFFYLEPLGSGSRPGLLHLSNGAGWEGEIEADFLKPVIKSPRECRSIVINLEDLKYRIFMCQKDKEELENLRESFNVTRASLELFEDRIESKVTTIEMVSIPEGKC